MFTIPYLSHRFLNYPRLPTAVMVSTSVLFVILVAGVMIATPAGFAPGHAQGADSQIMTCKEQHVLAERSNGKYACVYESTAEKLGWTVITVTTQTNDVSEPPDSGEASGLQVSKSDEQLLALK